MAMWQAYSAFNICRPLPLLFQFQGCAIVCALAFGWVYSARNRLKALDEARAFQKPSGRQPKVAVVLPVKGLRPSSLPHWRAQLALEYEGDLDFIFVVESVEDAAYPVLTQLMNERQDVSMRVVVAGLSRQCSQKIQNQMAGVASMSADVIYVLFLDDDISVHPGTVQLLVDAISNRPKALLVTGYPFDIPSKSLFSYCVMAFHLPLSVGFSTHGRTSFVWGGCMMLRGEDLRENRHGLITAWKQGGYSDDMTLGAIAGNFGREILVPAGAVFLHPLPDDFTANQYCNYLRRQIFVLFTHCSPFHCVLNRLLLLLHAYLSASLAAAFLLTTAHLLPAAAWRTLPIPRAQPPPRCVAGEQLSVTFLCCILLATLALRRLTASVLRLCETMSPSAPRVELGAFQWHKVWLGLFLGSCLYPVGAIVSSVRSDIEWSGVQYFVKHGKIERVVRGSDHPKCGKQAGERGLSRFNSFCSGILYIIWRGRGNVVSVNSTLANFTEVSTATH